jgi:deferrochelatase/peroxidase EfeB
VSRQDVYVPAEYFGFRDAIGGVVIEGACHGSPIRAGEFLLGHLDRTGRPPPMPQSETLGRNGTYVAFRKLHQDAAGFRAFIEASGDSLARVGAGGRQDGRALAAGGAAGTGARA